MISHNSPSLAGVGRAAHEVKFRLTREQFTQAIAWAEGSLVADAHGNPGYQTTTLYLDTADHKTLTRAPGYKQNKFRIRRYEAEDMLYLERKFKQGTRVRKTREVSSLGDLGNLLDPCEAESAFAHAIRSKALVPAMLGQYCRRAFSGTSTNGAIRLTLDQDIRVASAHSYSFDATSDWVDVPALVMELKFVDGLPAVFRELITELNLHTTTFSKYRQGMRALLGDVNAGVA